MEVKWKLCANYANFHGDYKKLTKNFFSSLTNSSGNLIKLQKVNEEPNNTLKKFFFRENYPPEDAYEMRKVKLIRS